MSNEEQISSPKSVNIEDVFEAQGPIFMNVLNLARQMDDEIIKLTELRKSIGLPRKVVAKRMGVKKSVVKDIESLCIDPTLTVFNSYVDAIGLSLTITTKVIEESGLEESTEREWRTFPTFRDCIDYHRMQENMNLVDENGRTLSYLEAFEQEGGGVSRPKNVHEHVVTGYYWRIITTDEKLNDIEYNILWNLDDFDLEVEICNLDSGMVLTDNLYSNICIDPSKIKLNIQQDSSGIVSWDIVPDERYWREITKYIKFKKYDDAVRFHKMLWLAMNVELEHEKQAKSNKETSEGF